MNEVITKHKLDFCWQPWYIDPSWAMFRVGTCHGLFNSDDKHYNILVVNNDEPGNGHLDDALEWFENSCMRDGKNLRIMEFFNDRFKEHLIKKRGFIEEGANHENVIKIYA